MTILLPCLSSFTDYSSSATLTASIIFSLSASNRFTYRTSSLSTSPFALINLAPLASSLALTTFSFGESTSTPPLLPFQTLRHHNFLQHSFPHMVAVYSKTHLELSPHKFGYLLGKSEPTWKFCELPDLCLNPIHR
jgi:hypothetical protein